MVAIWKDMVLSAARLAGVVAAASIMVGCALTPEKIPLNYTAAAAKPVPGAEAVSVQVSVEDRRLDKTRVGSKKNGFGMELAPISAETDVAITVQRALESELKARGFQAAPAQGSVAVIALLQRFYNDHKNGFFAGDAVAELNMQVSVKDKTGATIFSRPVTAQGMEANIQLASGNNARLALEDALRLGIGSLFQDQEFIAALIKAGGK